ncbi:MAG: DUF1732 domain-containing protein [bacterium]|nr:DUF1732 domain-containing protein [bacterium]MDE0418543.1 DUF1732 domain-containing protein [bacterium]
MAFQGMTGIASVAGRAWSWNARSVNGKGLDVRCRVPGGLEWLEPVARERSGRLMTRGSISLSLVLESDQATGVAVNHAALDDLVHVLEQRAGPPSPAALAGLLAVPGIVTVGARTDTGAIADELTTDLEAVLDRLVASRLGEGAGLAAIIGGLLDDVDNLVALAQDEACGEPERLRRALDERLRDLVDDAAIDDARLAQEVAFLVSRADVREEIDRLTAHAAAVRNLLEEASPGRQLGFFCQELLREANTLSSKSQSVPLTNAAVNLKVAIDRLREQAQNVE